MAEAVAEEYRCFVGGLAWATDDSRLEDAFRPYGQVLETKVVSDRETGRSRGFGFVTFANEKSMRDAIQSLNGSELDGRNITVNQAESRSNSGGSYRRGGGYGAGGGNRYGGSSGAYGSGRSGSDDRGSDRGYGASRNSGYGSRGGNFGASRGENGGSNAKNWRSNRDDDY